MPDTDTLDTKERKPDKGWNVPLRVTFGQRNDSSHDSCWMTSAFILIPSHKKICKQIHVCLFIFNCVQLSLQLNANSKFMLKRAHQYLHDIWHQLFASQFHFHLKRFFLSFLKGHSSYSIIHNGETNSNCVFWKTYFASLFRVD